jgi:septal ring factor EnvC (AmiA/AmiB activator)
MKRLSIKQTIITMLITLTLIAVMCGICVLAQAEEYNKTLIKLQQQITTYKQDATESHRKAVEVAETEKQYKETIKELKADNERLERNVRTREGLLENLLGVGR